METPEIWHPARLRAFLFLMCPDRNPSGGVHRLNQEFLSTYYATFIILGSLSSRTFLTSPSLHRQFG